MSIDKRLSQLEAISAKMDDAPTLAFMVNGATDDEVTAVRTMHGAYQVRLPDETLAELVDRVKAETPLAAAHILFFEYADELRQRLGTEYLPEELPGSWPDPSPLDHARHAEARP